MNDEENLRLALFVLDHTDESRPSHAALKLLAEEAVLSYIIFRKPELIDNLNELTKEMNKLIIDNATTNLVEDGYLEVNLSGDEVTYSLASNISPQELN